MFTGTIKVKICEATDLRRTDCMSRHFLVTGVGKGPQDQTLDPYVSLDVDEVHWNKTQPRQKTFTPVWNECFEHEVEGAAHLGLKIFHDSAVGNDDFVANATVPFDEIYSDNKTHADMWVSLGVVVFEEAVEVSNGSGLRRGGMSLAANNHENLTADG